MFSGPLNTSSLPDGKASDTGLIVKRLFGMMATYKRRLIAVPVLGLATAAASALAPYLIGRIFDQFIARADIAGLTRTVLFLVGIYCLSVVARIVQSYIMGWVSQQVLYKLREQIFGALQRQSMAFFDRNESGDLQSRLLNDVDVINNLLGQGLVQAVASLLGIVGILVGMFLLNWRLALASCIVIPLMFGVTNFFSTLARRAYRKTRETIGNVSANLQEDIAGVKVAQAFNRVELNRERFAERNAANRDANVGASAVTAAFFPAMDVLSTIAISIVAGYGGYLVITGQATLGVIVAFLGYVQQFFWPIQQLGQLYTQAQSALAAAERIFGLVDEPVDLRDPEEPVEPGRLAGRVAFEGVYFAYDPSHPVLQGIDFEIEPGQAVALVGPTGAGKTTIVNLVARFYDVTDGRVTIDGIDVRDVAIGSIRSQMGIVPQNSFLFSGSIRDNIRYGRLEAADEEIEQAARLARADDFIKRLPKGYDSPVGQRGGNLSQGQRQLVAIARSILADPRILILDEATSSVDTRTELLIQQALAQLLAGRTSFVIAHRLSTIRNADLVLVINDGQIVERGTHHELLARGGMYAELHRRQFRDSAEETVGERVSAG
ncbi:MAG TPA: ABC transporter ATP-binding protein [Chloroflexota bacterium]|nr:ABC transporter ATP-binding protein [Chloroflexota bacterium]